MTSAERRSSCIDPIPTCGQICGKELPCGPEGKRSVIFSSWFVPTLVKQITFYCLENKNLKKNNIPEMQTFVAFTCTLRIYYYRKRGLWPHARPSNDPRPPASCTSSCGNDPYLSSLSNCAVVDVVVVVVVCKLYFIILGGYTMKLIHQVVLKESLSRCWWQITCPTKQVSWPYTGLALPLIFSQMLQWNRTG
jgi:hypothetical protein